MPASRDQPLKALVFSIQKMSTEDGPGIRTTVFFKGCSLRCAWCSNPEGISAEPVIMWFGVRCIGCQTCVGACPQGALAMDEDGLHIDRTLCNGCGICATECPSGACEIAGKYYTVDELFEEVDKDRVFYAKSGGGVTVSGGEPTMQWQFLKEFLRTCKENAINTAIETCGFNTQRVYEQVLPYLDLVMLDLKEMDPAKHAEFCGHSNDQILENAKWIGQQPVEMWIRTPIIPGATATEENVEAIGAFIKEHLPNVTRWDLCAFLNLCKSKYERLGIDWAFKDADLFEKDFMEHLADVARDTGVKCSVAWSGLYKRGESEEGETPLKSPSQKCC
ncbi:MAG TPA: glycyl-radical enzyme activating protein [Candidatus Lokiarchaeia archaeon]|nr:glycyl-radical enzyme activating protein [Candidatus Lokiarchaeia archaeon]